MSVDDEEDCEDDKGLWMRSSKHAHICSASGNSTSPGSEIVIRGGWGWDGSEGRVFDGQFAHPRSAQHGVVNLQSPANSTHAKVEHFHSSIRLFLG